MGNPFETLDLRLSNIENLLLDISKKNEQSRVVVNHPDEILNIRQASELLGLAIPTLYSMVSERRIPFSKEPKGKKLMFVKSELIAWVKNSRRSTTNELELAADNYLSSKKMKK
ncbi:MAG: helix-turn-helix domain-containing protein [Bacteroidota bacterium]